MRCLERNKRIFWYCLYVGTEEIMDENGLYTGESIQQYSETYCMRANISAASGSAQTEPFGVDLSYDYVIVIDDPECLIDEHTLLCVDGDPTYDSSGRMIPDCVVKRVSRSLNSVSYAVSKVKVSG